MNIPTQLEAYIAAEESYLDGAVIADENSHGDWMYILLEGRAKLKKKTPDGDMVIDRLKAGNIFGEMNLFDTSRSSRFATLVADGPVVVGVLDIRKLHQDWIALSPSLRALIVSLIRKRYEAVSTYVTMMLNLHHKRRSPSTPSDA